MSLQQIHFWALVLAFYCCFFQNFQKQPSRGVFREKYSEHMQQIYKRASLLKLNFRMGVLLWICCKFSEHLFIRAPLKDCFQNFFNRNNNMAAKKSFHSNDNLLWKITSTNYNIK